MEESRRRRLWWRSRRGLLELDLLLVPFVEQKLGSLSATEQNDFERLLQEDDPLLLEWLQRRAEPHDEGLRRLVELIIG